MISARLDHLPITPTTRRAAVVVGVGLFFEFYELFLASVLSTVLVQRFDLDKADLAPLLASTFVGMFLGALVVGRLADRFGRHPAFSNPTGVRQSGNHVWLGSLFHPAIARFSL
ncbi:hypothetical protein ACFQ1S_27830 [Kibdelosporangium lantanae]|uniref:Major facilitator superfamily (MFS) profile domain-containing protein n=1 Tax=Kibdelosporangium lantanae TaxID=1497396 RepID=A0ABW3MIN7_9PSEU